MSLNFDESRAILFYLVEFFKILVSRELEFYKEGTVTTSCVFGLQQRTETNQRLFSNIPLRYSHCK